MYIPSFAPMFAPKLAVAGLVFLCGSALCGSALAADAADQPSTPLKASAKVAATRVVVPTHQGPVAFLIATLDAPTSAASREEPTLKPPTTAGYTFNSRVIIRANDLQTAARAVGREAKVSPARPDAAPGSPMRRFFYADTASVRAAIALATRLSALGDLELAYLDIEWPKTLRNTVPTDPSIPQQWHLINTTNVAADINADGAWKAGYTGTGITVGVLEGGWDITHQDIAANFDADASQPAAGQADHGTSTAGLVAAVANNGIGGAGVAWGAKVSRLYYGSPSQINAAFAFANNLNDIKTNSWGPFDNGRISVIDPLELAGIEDAAINGRAGKGEIIVWAGGNGGASNNDRVDYDPYASNRFSIAVGAIDFFDRRSIYSEPGSALMLVTTSDYDLFSSSDVGIFTTSGNNGYTATFGGTSSSSPIAAGVAALVLQANPNLTWRDVQHVLIRSARRCTPADASWAFNGSGAGDLRLGSELFGFGAIDAGAAVALASTWTNRPVESSNVLAVIPIGLPIPDNNPEGIASSVQVTGPMLVERAQVTLVAAHTNIGNLRIVLTSPSGTQSVLASTRNDTTFGGYNAYTFTSVRFWEERAAGNWTIRVADLTPLAMGTFTSWQLKLHGYTPGCFCDWNVSGTIGLQDLFDFLASFFAGNGDFDSNGTTSLQDLFDFLECWFAGC